MRKIKGVFLENLELNDFPVDVQVSIERGMTSPMDPCPLTL